MKPLSVSKNNKLLDSGLSHKKVITCQAEADPENDISRKTLLIVDDDSGPKLSLNVIFRDEFHTLTASSATEAFELIRNNPVHIAVLDFNLPDQSGIEVFRFLKKIHPDSETILYAGLMSVGLYQKAFRERVFDCVPKPLEIQELRETVYRAVRSVEKNRRVRSLQTRLKEAEDCIEFFESKRHEQLEKEQLYAQMTHDLNCSLSGLSGYIDILNGQITSIPDECFTSGKVETARALDACKDQVQYAVNLSRRYLNFLSLPSNNFNATSHLPHVLEEFQRTSSFLSDFENVKIIIPDCIQNLSLSIHPIDLLQCLTNLATNAAQAVGQNTILRLSFDRVSHLPGSDQDYAFVSANNTDEIKLWWILPSSDFRKQNWVEISVEDNGPGICAEHLYESNATSPTLVSNQEPIIQRRKGLGLRIVERIIKDSEGGVFVESAPNRGTKFRIFIPVHEYSAVKESNIPRELKLM